jgi:NarL family two-component system response regulator LiaR
MMKERILVFFADDHAIVREGLRAVLATQPDMEVVGEAADGREAVEKLEKTPADVVLMDLVMPRMDGLTAISEIKRRNPAARILVLTSFAADDKVFPAIKAGALGYLLKDSPSPELLRAVRDVYNGKPSLHPSIALKMMKELRHPQGPEVAHEALTGRETMVLRLVARGLSNEEIAHDLVISERTVNAHITNILGKLHVANRVQATLCALREGLACI